MRIWIVSAILGTAVVAHASKPGIAPQTVLARVRASHRIFVSNMGENSTMSVDGGLVHLLYGELYQDLATWPGVQLVGTPAQADLIFAVRGFSSIDADSAYIPTRPHRDPIKNLSTPPTVSPMAYVDAIDPGTGKVLWSSGVSFGYMFSPKAATAKAIKVALEPFEANGRGPKPSKSPALLPTQLTTAHRLFFELTPFFKLPPSPSQTAEMQQVQAPLTQALASTCGCQWVSSPSASDLIVRVTVELTPGDGRYPLSSLRLDILDPKTRIVVWSFTNGFILDEDPATQIEKTMPYVMKNWTAVIGKDHL